MKGVECNIDDVLCHGPTQEVHDRRLKAVLDRLAATGVTLNVDKCTFSAPKIKLLENVVSANGIEADPDKITAIVNFPAPSNVHDVLIFLGMVNHMGKFVRALS